MVDPAGQLPRWDGAAWISQDGRFWWNGTAWQPIVRRRQTPWGLIALAIAIIAVIAIVVHSVPRQIIDTTQYGVTNAQIDSPTLIEFDYRAKDSCNNLTFVYTFYDAQGIKVGEFQDEHGNQVTGGKSYHFTISTTNGQSIDPSATRFTATPNCSS
jgi:hypothetical protein